MIVTDFHQANHWKGERRWWFGKRLGRAALELLGELTGVSTYEQHGKWNHNSEHLKTKSAAVLLDDNTVFAKEGYFCFSIHQPPGEKQIINIGRTTIFYAALIAQILNRDTHLFESKINSFKECPYNNYNPLHPPHQNPPIILSRLTHDHQIILPL